MTSRRSPRRSRACSGVVVQAGLAVSGPSEASVSTAARAIAEASASAAVSPGRALPRISPSAVAVTRAAPFPGHGRGRALFRLLISLVQAGTALGVSALGDAIGVDQPRASRLVSQGVELGLLRREADPDDARRTLIALTDKGQSLTNRFRGAQRDNVDQALSTFTEDERAQLASLLTRLADAWPK
jgi:DNA-binding MarR family transcriptional regulator